MAMLLEREKLKACSACRIDAHLWYLAFFLWIGLYPMHGKGRPRMNLYWLGFFSSLFVLFLIAYFFTLTCSASLLFLCSCTWWLLDLMTITINPWLVSFVKRSSAFDGALLSLCWVHVKCTDREVIFPVKKL